MKNLVFRVRLIRLSNILSVILVLRIIMFSQLSVANDTAAEVAAGGIQFKEEARISLEQEDLFIRQECIEVVYTFKNRTHKDITTLIAFPIPQYTYYFDIILPDFQDFSVEVNGIPIQYEKDIRALVNDNDYTALLNKYNISISDFGGFAPDIDEELLLKKLKSTGQDVFFQYNLLQRNQGRVGWPNWTVAITYYWSQVFPANSITIIKHTYSPYIGYGELLAPEFACMDDWLRQNATPTDEYFSAQWISYILTTANNWKGPIKTFNIVIDKPEDTHVFVCFDSAIMTEDSKAIEIHRQDYSPTQNLIIYYVRKEEG